MGDKVDAIRIPLIQGRKRGQPTTAHRGFWDWTARVVMRRPVVSLVLATGVLLAAASSYLDLNQGEVGVSALPDGLMAKDAYVVLQEEFGFELFLAQTGQHPPSAKPLKGISSGVVELVEDYDGDTYRAVYTVRFETAVYVLHCFKKKSKSGIKTPQSDIELVKRRLRDAEAHHAANKGSRAYDQE